MCETTLVWKASIPWYYLHRMGVRNKTWHLHQGFGMVWSYFKNFRSLDHSPYPPKMWLATPVILKFESVTIWLPLDGELHLSVENWLVPGSWAVGLCFQAETTAFKKRCLSQICQRSCSVEAKPVPGAAVPRAQTNFATNSQPRGAPCTETALETNLVVHKIN